MKEMYEDIQKENIDDNEDLLKTANLSLEILSDLKGDNDNTMIEPPIKEEFLDEEDNLFYSNKYKFNKKDFEDNDVSEEADLLDEDDDSGNSKFFLKILLLIFGIAMVVVIGIYLFSYFNRV